MSGLCRRCLVQVMVKPCIVNPLAYPMPDSGVLCGSLLYWLWGRVISSVNRCLRMLIQIQTFFVCMWVPCIIYDWRYLGANDALLLSLCGDLVSPLLWNRMFCLLNVEAWLNSKERRWFWYQMIKMMIGINDIDMREVRLRWQQDLHSCHTEETNKHEIVKNH